jgi:hypothetical protein
MPGISKSAARCRALKLSVLLTTAACGGHSEDLGRYGTTDASSSSLEADGSTGTSKPSTDAAVDANDGSTDDGGIDVTTACLADDNKFVFLEEPSLPVVIEGTDWLVSVEFVIDGLPSYLDIMINPEWDAQFSTNGLGKPLLPGGRRDSDIRRDERPGAQRLGHVRGLQHRHGPVPGDRHEGDTLVSRRGTGRAEGSVVHSDFCAILRGVAACRDGVHPRFPVN